MKVACLLLFLTVCAIYIGASYQWPSKGRLIWNSEMNSILDVNLKWNQDTYGNKLSWGNSEWQYCTNNNNNIFISNGALVIQARKEYIGGNKGYTSAHLSSKRLFKYGVFEMRARLPWGRGTRPAFWLLNADRIWPSGGEIDIMEHFGNEMGKIHASIHCQANNEHLGNTPTRNLWVRGVETDYHIYQLEWSPTSINSYVDGKLFFRYNKPKMAGVREWPFDRQFELVLNLAVGGTWGGQHDVNAGIWPQNYFIDYVRVYQLAQDNEDENEEVDVEVDVDVEVEIDEEVDNGVNDETDNGVDEEGNNGVEVVEVEVNEVDDVEVEEYQGDLKKIEK